MVKIFSFCVVLSLALAFSAATTTDEEYFDAIDTNGPSASNGEDGGIRWVLGTGRRIAFNVGSSLWSAGAAGINYVREHAPTREELKQYTANMVARVQEGRLPVCVKVELPSLEELKAGFKKYYFKTPLPRIVNYVSDNSPEALKTYVNDLYGLSRTLAKDIAQSNPPIKQVKQFAADVFEAAKVFAGDVHSAAPSDELVAYGKKVYEAAKLLSERIANGVPVKDLATEAKQVSSALADFSVKVANPKNLPYVGVAKYAQETFASIWNNHIKRSAVVQHADGEQATAAATEVPPNVQPSDEPDLKEYAELVQQASAEFYRQVHADAEVDAHLKQFAKATADAATEFATTLHSELPSVALNRYSGEVWAATKKFVGATAYAVPKMSLLFWASKVGAAGAKFLAGVVWKTPFKMQAFSSPMYAISALKQAKEKHQIPSWEELQNTTACDYVTAAWRMTHNLYVKVKLNNYTAVFEKIPAEEWSDFIRAKAGQIRDGSVELYTRYGPGTGKPTELANTIQGRLVDAAHALQEFYDCAIKNGYFEVPKAVLKTIRNGVAQYLPASVRQHAEKARNTEGNADHIDSKELLDGKTA